MAEIFDLTQIIDRKTKVYLGDPLVNIESSRDPVTDISLTKVSMGLHTGTHLDAPRHLFKEGKDVAQLDLSYFSGKAICLQATMVGREIHFDAKQLEIIQNEKPDWVLIATGFDMFWGKPEYFTNHPFLSLATAKKLIRMNIKGVGIDCPSIDAPGKTLPVHSILLKSGILIVENLTGLKKLPAISFQIVVCPIKIAAEAAPTRVLALF